MFWLTLQLQRTFLIMCFVFFQTDFYLQFELFLCKIIKHPAKRIYKEPYTNQPLSELEPRPEHIVPLHFYVKAVASLLLFLVSASALEFSHGWPYLMQTTRVCRKTQLIEPRTRALTVVIDTSKRPPILLTTVSVHLNHNQVFVPHAESVCIEHASSSVPQVRWIFQYQSNIGKPFQGTFLNRNNNNFAGLNLNRLQDVNFVEAVFFLLNPPFVLTTQVYFPNLINLTSSSVYFHVFYVKHVTR